MPGGDEGGKEERRTNQGHMNLKDDDVQAWLRQYHPLIEVRFNDGRVVAVPFNKLDETLLRRGK